ncbi:uncharacterized protein GGS25DRAFT_152079 [Hypoxylon fragiforme]|uniref:uncharacterized protein n=1 Tax=Hypoxylon fragiforme TaxID=63214 RepID=UPI0020C6B19C|nr:uncharacterized protein GGS25DRAFT_152079 [Hypoxylon fragiforme]KAI2613148.1 hypothetical protein GGS25DRAFT_152079 [Hypoxylon fragiforme]
MESITRDVCMYVCRYNMYAYMYVLTYIHTYLGGTSPVSRGTIVRMLLHGGIRKISIYFIFRNFRLLSLSPPLTRLGPRHRPGHLLLRHTPPTFLFCFFHFSSFFFSFGSPLRDSQQASWPGFFLSCREDWQFYTCTVTYVPPAHVVNPKTHHLTFYN